MAIALLVILIYHKIIGHILVIIGVVLEYTVIVAASMIALTVMSMFIVRLRRRQTDRGACLTCDHPCQGKQDATATVLTIHPFQVGDKKYVVHELESDSNVTSLASWKNKQNTPSVG
jgi:hypothetical protein